MLDEVHYVDNKKAVKSVLTALLHEFGYVLVC